MAEDDAMRDSSADSGGPWIAQLSEADAQRLDAHLDPAEAGPPPADAIQRDRKVQQVLSLIEQCPAERGDQTLVNRTLQRIQAQRESQQLTQQAHMLAAGGETTTGPGPASAGGGGGGFSMGQMMTLAGMVLIGASLLLPVLSQNRQLAMQVACQRKLAAAGGAIAQYAADHNGTLPRGKVEPGVAWWHVGQPHEPGGVVRSNSAHLYLLVRHENDYLEPATLACPSNAHAHPEKMTDHHHDWPSVKAISFSYQNQYTPEPIELNRNPELALLADKNPLFINARGKPTQATCPTTAPSLMHQRRGQNVLTADGNVAWRTSPTLHLSRGIGPAGLDDKAQASAATATRPGTATDNIWVVRGIERYHGNETPNDPNDSFLVP